MLFILAFYLTYGTGIKGPSPASDNPDSTELSNSRAASSDQAGVSFGQYLFIFHLIPHGEGSLVDLCYLAPKSRGQKPIENTHKLYKLDGRGISAELPLTDPIFLTAEDLRSAFPKSLQKQVL